MPTNFYMKTFYQGQVENSDALEISEISDVSEFFFRVWVLDKYHFSNFDLSYLFWLQTTNKIVYLQQILIKRDIPPTYPHISLQITFFGT